MKIELKHLAGYLPYGLKVINKRSKYPLYEREEILTFENIKYVLPNQANKLKPILHPLSDLTKEIEVNGEKFVPIEKLLKERDCDVEYDFIEALEDDWASADDKIEFAPYSIIKKLQEWHFDHQGLIEKDLAIDRNTLKL